MQGWIELGLKWCVVEEVLELCGGMEEEGEGSRSRARIIFAGSVVDSFVYGASGLSVVGEGCLTFGDERWLVLPQSKSPHLKRITIHDWMAIELWCFGGVNHKFASCIGGVWVFCLDDLSNRELHISSRQSSICSSLAAM